MKKQKPQKHEQGWCKYCKRITMFVTHADLNYWVCQTPGCNRREDELQKEPKKPILYESWKPNTRKDMYL